MKKLLFKLKGLFTVQANLRYITLIVTSVICVFVISKIITPQTQHKTLITFFIVLIYFLLNVIALVAFKMLFRKDGSPSEEFATREYLYSAANNVSFPIAVFGTLTGEYRASNKAFRLMKKKNGIRGKLFSEYTGGIKLSEFLKEEHVEGIECTVGDTTYLVKITLDFTENENRIVAEWHDKSDVLDLRQTIVDEDSLIAFIVIDNLDELAQMSNENHGSSAAEVAHLLYNWADSVEGIIKEYSHEKFLLIYKAKYLSVFRQDKFEILNEVKKVKVGSSSFPITISIGTSDVGATLTEKEKNAKTALDMALARGGDQAIVKTNEKPEIYGGYTKAVQSRNTVKSRTVALALRDQIQKSPNVLIMGHRFADYDAFGACIGIARLCISLGTPCNIVTNVKDPNLTKCFEKAYSVPGNVYENVFVSATEAQELLINETLLVIVDVNNPLQFEAPDLYKSATKVVFIDHHSQMGEFSKQPLIYNIDPTASSACELVCEILECALPTGELTPNEADLMYAGIVLDTKRFAVNTGMRTFLEAYYLRDEGANPMNVQEFFKDSISDIVREGRFSDVISIHEGEVAIAVNRSPDNTDLDRIMAAKFADKLLMAEGVKASFAVVQIDSTIRISGRSTGTVNVRMILEKLKGGGHYDQAATQINDMTIDEAVETLISAIDDYYDIQNEMNSEDNG